MADEYYLKPPSKQLFYNIMAYLLSIVALNSDCWQFYKIPDHFYFRFQRWLVVYGIPVLDASQVLYLAINYSQQEFNTLAMIYTVLPISFMVLLKVTVAQSSSYKRAIAEFMDQIHVFSYYRDNRQPYVKEILIKTEIYIRRSFYILSTLCFSCALSFIVVPIIHNFQNNESIYNITTRLEITIHFWLPIDYEFNFLNWAIMQVLTVYCVILAVSIIIIFDILNLAFLYHLIGHIKILKHILKYEFKGKMTQDGIKRKLIEVSQYYTFIKKIFKHVEGAFGVNIVGIYLHNLFGGSIMIYQFMSAGTDIGTLLSYGLMIPFYMGELIIVSLLLENIRIQTDDISMLVYDIPWEKMTIPNQKLVLMILFQVQPVLEFKAAFNVKTGVKPAMQIIKTTFSYYVIMQSRI